MSLPSSNQLLGLGCLEWDGGRGWVGRRSGRGAEEDQDTGAILVVVNSVLLHCIF